MSTLTADTNVRRTGQLLETEVDGDVVAIDVDSGRCYGLNTVGSDIWRLLEKTRSIAEICNVLVHEYDVSMEQCEPQVRALVSELITEGLVEVCKS